MSADEAGILADVSEMLLEISESLLPGEEITMETTLVSDLDLQSIGLARLAGRLQAKYGIAANLVAFFARQAELPDGEDPGAPAGAAGGAAGELSPSRRAADLSEVTVGDLVRHLARAQGRAAPQAADARLAEALAGLADQVVGRCPAPGGTFVAAGYTPFDMLRLIGTLEARFGELSKTLLYDYPTAPELAGYLSERFGPVRASRLLGAPLPDRQAGDPAAWNPQAGDPAEPDLPDGFMAITDRHQPRNDNVAVLAEEAPGITATVLSLPGGEVEVLAGGRIDGPALVLVHPINLGAGVFARLLARLAGQYRLICVHHPGVGATTWAADMSQSGLAQLQRAALAELAIEPPFHLVGSSFGGLVALEFALQHPGECASLTLVGSSYRVSRTPGGPRPLPTAVAEELDLISQDGPMEGDRAELAELLLRCESWDSRVGLGYLTAFAKSRPSLLGQLGDVVTPTLILHGRHDTVTPAKHAHLLYGAIPDAELGELAQAGHYPYLTHPGLVERLLVPFLAAHPQPPQARPPRRTERAAARPAARPTAPAPAAVPDDMERSIILSSGRCGSTMLSNLIVDEPDTLSVFETLIALRRHLVLMPTADISGPEFWSLMADPGRQGEVTARIGAAPEEACYPETGRWAGDPRGIPPILQCALPRMSVDPDHLFDILADQVVDFPDQPVTQHVRMLLDLLAAMSGRSRWVERSGGSSSVAAPMLTALPDLKVVYLTRNIEDTVRSMSKHSSFQFALIRFEFQLRYGTDPYSRRFQQDLLPDPADMPEEIARLLPDRITLDALQSMSADVGPFERMYAHMQGSAEQALADLKPRYLHRIRYEDVLADPVTELTQLGKFLGFADPPGWAVAAAAKVRPARARVSR